MKKIIVALVLITSVLVLIFVDNDRHEDPVTSCVRAEFDRTIYSAELSVEFLCEGEEWGPNWQQTALTLEKGTSIELCQEFTCEVIGARASIYLGDSRDVDYDAIYDPNQDGDCRKNTKLDGMTFAVGGKSKEMSLYSAKGLPFKTCGHVALSNEPNPTSLLIH